MTREILKTLYDSGHVGGSSESCVILRENGALFKVRFQCDQGTGSDNIWLRPGESKRGYSFTHEEAAKFQEQKDE